MDAGTLLTAPPRARVTAVLFDLDDTLYDVGDLVVGVWRERASELGGLGLDVEELCSAYQRVRPGLPCELAIELALEALGRPDVPVAAARDMVVSTVPARLPLRPGAAELLAGLRGDGVAVALVTNGEAARQHAKVAALGLGPLVDVVVCSGCGKVPAKPSPVAFELALQQLGRVPAQALFVGDRPDRDVAPAVELGMEAVRLVAGHYAQMPAHPQSALESADPAELWAHVVAAVRR